MKFETEVDDVVKRTYNVKSFRFKRPSSLDYRPGQFMFITIKIGPEEKTKHFTISSSPTEKDSIEFTKKLTGHDFSNALDSLKVGDWARIDAPYGSFTFKGEYEKIAMLTGGIGITPIRSICKYCTDMRLASDILLIYGNRTKEDIIFEGEFDEMQRRNKNLKVVYTLDEPPSNWTGLKGRIDADMIRTKVPDYSERIFYSCGPPGMVRAMEDLLRNLGLPQDRIRKENFAGY